MKNKICVYTCITGDYDNLIEYDVKEEGIDYYFFTNNKNFKSDFWHVIYIQDEDIDNSKLSKKIKILGHKLLEKYDYTVWMDGSIYPKQSIKMFINKYCDFTNYSLIGFKHSASNCIYDEAKRCIYFKKEKEEIIEKQMSAYRKDNYPVDNGLIEAGILFRRNNDDVLKKTMFHWFNQILNFSCRDQLSFSYSAYKNNLDFHLLDLNIYENDYFASKKHNVKKNLKKYYVYFGNDIDFNDFKLIDGDWNINNNNYNATFKVPKNCDKIKFEFTNCKGILFSNLIVESKNIVNKNLVNQSQYLDKIIFDNDIPTLFLEGKFRKNQVIKLSIEMEIMSEDQYIDLLKELNAHLIRANHTIRTLSKNKDSIIKRTIRKIKVFKQTA